MHSPYIHLGQKRVWIHLVFFVRRDLSDATCPTPRPRNERPRAHECRAAACAVSGTRHDPARHCVYEIPLTSESLRCIWDGAAQTSMPLGADRGVQGHRRRRLFGQRDARELAPSDAVRFAFAANNGVAATCQNVMESINSCKREHSIVRRPIREYTSSRGTSQKGQRHQPSPTRASQWL